MGPTDTALPPRARRAMTQLGEGEGEARTVIARRLLAVALLFLSASSARSQIVGAPPNGDYGKQGMLRDVALGVLPRQGIITEEEARAKCPALPNVEPGDTTLDGRLDRADAAKNVKSAACKLVALDTVKGAHGAWRTGRYHSVWVMPDDTVTEEEAVLYEVVQPGELRAAWHGRFFDTGDREVWRSITLEVAATPRASTLLSVQYCVNGTGGCEQDFIERRTDGRWHPVFQAWDDQLPAAVHSRILHGMRIEPATLKGEGGYYEPADPNCCPSELLRLTLTLRNDSLVLVRHTIVKTPQEP